MAKPKLLHLDGKTYLWREIVDIRRAQIRAARELTQPKLFELRDDRRPKTQKTAAGRANALLEDELAVGRHGEVEGVAGRCETQGALTKFEFPSRRRSVALIHLRLNSRSLMLIVRLDQRHDPRDHQEGGIFEIMIVVSSHLVAL